jgi:N-acetyl-1-D-myo-inositol-2-amino-2-deoxy-alpha-D-glucopyranoside deacetylase
VAKTLLAVLAHPDDESFGLGGTLALYARRGVDVYLVCATRGEVGDMDPKYMEGFNTIADRREHELRCAAGHLGLKEVFFLGYRDSGMPGTPDNLHPQSLFSQPVEKVAADVVHYIRLLKPQVVITFDPIGGYRHPDHIALHNATVLAFEKSDDPTFAPGELPPYKPFKLYYQTFPHGILRVGVRLMRLFGQDPRKVGKNRDIDLESIAAVNFPTNARINFRPVADIRDEAAACHASQGSGSSILTRPLNALRRAVASYETFMRAYPEPGPNAPLEKDLFEGV